jgi:hypothetical protein
MDLNRLIEAQDELGALDGDPRCCPYHPHIKISSADGMHDGLCGQCEYNADLPEEESFLETGWKSPEEPLRYEHNLHIDEEFPIF